MLREQADPEVKAESALPGDGSSGDDEAMAARGDNESFVLLYRSYLGPVYRYLYLRLGNRHDAEDLTSQVFQRAWESLPQYRPQGSFRGWLFTITARTLADHRRRSPHATLSVDDLASTLHDPSASPEETALAADRVRSLLDTLARLSSEQQEVITLRFMAELRYSEISAIVGKSEAAVKMIAYRALEEMKRSHLDA